MAQDDYILWLDASTLPAAPSLRLVEGDGAADPERDVRVPFPEALARLEELVARGELEARDPKARFDGVAVDADGVALRVGPTHYRHCMADLADPGETARRAALGQRRHGDPRRYLACGLGAVVLPRDGAGRVLLGVRAGDTYRGWLHGPGGWLPFSRDVARLDPAAHAALECEEELGLTGLAPLELLGLVSYRGSFETDLVYTVRLADDVLDELLRGRWCDAADAAEHSELVRLTPAQALRDGRRRVPSTEFGLRALLARGQGECP